MPIPDYQAFYGPLLEFAMDGEEHSFREAVEHLAQRYGLTVEERELLIPSRGQRLLDNRVGWGRTYLAKAGLLEAPRRGVFRITDRGRNALASGQPITNRFLRQFPEFIDFLAPRATEGETGPETPATPRAVAATQDAVETTPEELIESGYQQLHRAVASELRDRVRSCTPGFFEKLVVELLVAMGYGGSLGDAGKAIGRSGDQGIDGIIKEDRIPWTNTRGRKCRNVISAVWSGAVVWRRRGRRHPLTGCLLRPDVSARAAPAVLARCRNAARPRVRLAVAPPPRRRGR